MALIDSTNKITAKSLAETIYNHKPLDQLEIMTEIKASLRRMAHATMEEMKTI